MTEEEHRNEELAKAIYSKLFPNDVRLEALTGNMVYRTPKDILETIKYTIRTVRDETAKVFQDYIKNQKEMNTVKITGNTMLVEPKDECQNLSLPSWDDLEAYWKQKTFDGKFPMTTQEVYFWLRANMKKQEPISDVQIAEIAVNEYDDTDALYIDSYTRGFRAAEKCHGIGEGE